MFVIWVGLKRRERDFMGWAGVESSRVSDICEYGSRTSEGYRSRGIWWR